MSTQHPRTLSPTSSSAKGSVDVHSMPDSRCGCKDDTYLQRLPVPRIDSFTMTKTLGVFFACATGSAFCMTGDFIFLSLFSFFFSLSSFFFFLFIYICVIQRIIGVLRTKRLESGPQKTKSVSGRGGFWQGGRQMFPVYYTGR